MFRKWADADITINQLNMRNLRREKTSTSQTSWKKNHAWTGWSKRTTSCLEKLPCQKRNPIIRRNRSAALWMSKRLMGICHDSENHSVRITMKNEQNSNEKKEGKGFKLHRKIKLQSSHNAQKWRNNSAVKKRWKLHEENNCIKNFGIKRENGKPNHMENVRQASSACGKCWWSRLRPKRFLISRLFRVIGVGFKRVWMGEPWGR